MKTKKKPKKFVIYDWHTDKFAEVGKKKFDKYQKLKAEMHNIMYPKKTA